MRTAVILIALGLAIAVAGVIAPGPGGLYVALGIIVIAAGIDLASGLYLIRKRSRRRRAGYLHRR